jgi:hypothetical protein
MYKVIRIARGVVGETSRSRERRCQRSGVRCGDWKADRRMAEKREEEEEPKK